jgi:hypothetical protein
VSAGRRAGQCPGIPRTSSDGGSASMRSSARVRDDVARALCRAGSCSSCRMLAVLMSWLGADLGANVTRHPAAPGHIQPQSMQAAGTQSDAWRRLATDWACMACKRSGVRIPLSSTRFRSSEACCDLENDLDLLLAASSRRPSSLILRVSPRRSGPSSRSRTRSVPIRAFSWEPTGSQQVVCVSCREHLACV